MEVSAISAVRNSNSINFEGKKNKSQPQTNYSKSTNPLKAAPVVVLMAMHPSLLNAGNLPEINPETNGIEFVVPNTVRETGAAYLYEVQQAPRNRKLPEVIVPENIHYQRQFKAEGKNWTMYYVTFDKKNIGNKVQYIYLIPDDYRQIVDHYNQDENSPPVIDKVIYHDTGKETEFVGVYTHERISDKGELKTVRREIRVPDEIGNDILALLSDETKWIPNKNLVKSFTAVNTNKLAPKTVEAVY